MCAAWRATWLRVGRLPGASLEESAKTVLEIGLAQSSRAPDRVSAQKTAWPPAPVSPSCPASPSASASFAAEPGPRTVAATGAATPPSLVRTAGSTSRRRSGRRAATATRRTARGARPAGTRTSRPSARRTARRSSCRCPHLTWAASATGPPSSAGSTFWQRSEAAPTTPTRCGATAKATTSFSSPSVPPRAPWVPPVQTRPLPVPPTMRHLARPRRPRRWRASSWPTRRAGERQPGCTTSTRRSAARRTCVPRCARSAASTCRPATKTRTGRPSRHHL